MNIVIINRRFYGWNWDNRYTNYYGVIDHRSNQVFYVVDGKSILGLHLNEKMSSQIIELESLNDIKSVKQAVRDINLRTPVDRIVALNEEDILIASELRDELNILGDREKDVNKFRNKMLMKRILKQHGIAIPAFTSASNVDEIIEKFGFPVVLKPLDGACSRGVKICLSQTMLDKDIAEINEQLDNYEAEQFIDGNIFHLDGFMAGGNLIFCQVHQYYNSCYAFANGIPVGVMMMDDTNDQQIELKSFAKNSLNALGLHLGAFHLELFIDSHQNILFLEVGSRVGGAFFAQCIEKRWGVNLFEESIRLQIYGNLDINKLKHAKAQDKLYGWLLFPIPDCADCYVKSISYPTKNKLPNILNVMHPIIGAKIDKTGGYIHTAGAFLFEGYSQNELLQTIEYLIKEYTIRYF
ncbi:ATP-grasp domain-containing protein [Brenneria tiliae]|uniref:ATP-grasp domain-containing protein n=1 Tax=Brenneria tiliae TaxID=2914984 RepID=UPI002014D16B|nr:ATP-grasp domain-containing protein [Brenneria tiliae]MCL2897129.1 ATP-grasp domain-containing protein [Brenneria tiliae]MCL2904782.1 ATP-grasp domain-containing protein [Brenneria tiliae]